MATESPVAQAGAAPGVALTPDQTARRRAWALLVLTLGQLVIVVDATIVNVALPSMSTGLHVAEADRQWVITVYTLAFGGLLLIGGRVTDYLGLRRSLVIGLIGFGIASALGGGAQSLSMLLAARALQGVFAALLAPAALALLATTFTDAKERARAFAIFGVVAGGGSALGLVLGGVLTEYASWRWTMFINIPLTALTVVGAYLFVDEFKPAHPGRLDVIGTVLGTGGVFSLVYGFSEAERHGWTQSRTLFLLFLGISLLIMFVVSQRMVANPVLPLRILAHRTRAGANISIALSSLALFGAFFFLTFFMQGVLGYSPVRTGVAFLAVTGGIIVSSGIVSVLITKVPPRWIMGTGLIGAGFGMLLLTRLTPESTFLTGLLPFQVILGLCMGAVFVPAFNGATIGVEPRDASVASATINTAQQVGTSLGLALLSTIAAHRSLDWLKDHPVSDPQQLPFAAIAAEVQGYARAALWSAGIMFAAAAIIIWLVDVHRMDGAMHPELAGLTAVSSEPAADGSATLEDVPPIPRRPRDDAHTWAASGAPGARPIIGVTANGAHPDVAPSRGNVRGLVRDHFGQPIGRVALTLLDDAGRQLDRGWTDDNGRFSFLVSGPTEAVLVARHARHRPYACTVHVPLASADVEVEIGLLGTVGLVGTVHTLGANRPIVDATVTWSDDSGQVLASTRTDGAGRFQFADLTAGVGSVAVHREGAEPVRDAVLIESSGTTVHDVAVPGRAALAGVARTASGRAIPDARVWLEDVSGAVVANTRTDDAGHYAFSDVAEGSYTLRAVGYPPTAADVVISEASDVQIEVTLSHVDAVTSSR
jgi:EmrB/QacA subfamily drug resistance transporter